MSAFISTKDGNCYFRTKLFRSIARAESFCKCLTANRRFQNVSVIESNRTENGWYVQYQPSNPTRYADLYMNQYRQRELKGKSEGRCYEFDLHTDTQNRSVFYLCKSTSGEVYEVTECSCSCPDWRFRGRKSGLPCKHMHAYAVAVAAGDILSIAEVKLRAARVIQVAVAITAANTLQSRFAARGLNPAEDFS